MPSEARTGFQIDLHGNGAVDAAMRGVSSSSRLSAGSRDGSLSDDGGGGTSDDRGSLREIESQAAGSCTVARNRQDHRIPQAEGDGRSGSVTAPEPSISPGTAGLWHVRVIAYPLGECSSEAVTVSTKARKRVGCGWPFSFAWRSPCPRGHLSHRTSQ